MMASVSCKTLSRYAEGFFLGIAQDTTRCLVVGHFENNGD
jgi:hypothetical protein